MYDRLHLYRFQNLKLKLTLGTMGSRETCLASGSLEIELVVK